MGAAHDAGPLRRVRDTKAAATLDCHTGHSPMPSAPRYKRSLPHHQRRLNTRLARWFRGARRVLIRQARPQIGVFRAARCSRAPAGTSIVRVFRSGSTRRRRNRAPRWRTVVRHYSGTRTSADRWFPNSTRLLGRSKAEARNSHPRRTSSAFRSTGQREARQRGPPRAPWEPSIPRSPRRSRRGR